MCVSYIGGKSKISKFITPYIPKDIECYIEPFGGMFWVYFNMNLIEYPNLKNIIYNDFNKLNVNFFNCVKNYKEFYDVIKDYHSQKSELFYQFQKELFDNNLQVDLLKPDYHIASKYVYLLTQVWSGINCEKGKFIDLKGKYKSKFDTFKDKLKNEKWQKLFDKINIVENMDFDDIIKKYDSDKSFFYCDPPYYDLGEKYYVNHDFSIKDHERLSNTIKNIKGKFSLSYYYFEELEKKFPKDNYTWKSKEFSKPSMAKSGKEQSKGLELLIMNY